MPYVEQRGKYWRVRWRLPDGKYSSGVTAHEETGEKFISEGEARQYGADQETLIRLGIRKEKEPLPTVAEWATRWFAGLSLEPSTMCTYRSLLQGHILPVFGGRSLDELGPEEMDPWERGIVRAGYSPRTAKDARSLLGNLLGDAVPRYIPTNPATRRRGKGRKGLRRVEAYQRAAKVWPSPLEVVLVAERAALASGDDDVFVKLVVKAWTGLRWSEVLALSPEQLLAGGMLNVDRKLYQIKQFYRGYPKDGSLRVIDLPPFLAEALGAQARKVRTCICSSRGKKLPSVDGAELVEWCPGGTYLFLSPGRAHYQRSQFASAAMRPAADGVYPGRMDGGKHRPARPVLADVAAYGPTPARGRAQAVEGGYCWPGRPVHWPWPYAEADAEFIPPRGRGRPNWAAWPEGERPHLVSWLPIRPGLTPHGLRHGHQTWMDDAGIKRALKVERMGHEDPSMQGRYGHVTEGMRVYLRETLQALWETAVAERFAIWPTSPIPMLDAELARWRAGNVTKIISQFSPKNSKRALPA